MKDLFKQIRKAASVFILIAFMSTSLRPSAYAQAILNLPEPGTMISLSTSYAPLLIKGLKINPANPLNIDFIVATGNSRLTAQNPQFKTESEKLIKYFFAALTIPERNMWVNLSPYEKDRIIPKITGETEMGRDMLAQDYILKQMTASLIYPEKRLGKDFWNKIYTKVYQRFGSTQIPLNAFNKVWIVADKASVYEAKDTVLVLDGHLKVMLEEDYLALNKHRQTQPVNDTHALASQIVREIVLPVLEKEVNEGKNFAPLRQIYYSLILAKWYKETLKTALLNQVYSNKNKIVGVDVADKNIKEKIYQQYLKAYKKGVFNYIKEDIDQTTNQPIPRKYFSGGEVLNRMKLQRFNRSTSTPAMMSKLYAIALSSFILVSSLATKGEDAPASNPEPANKQAVAVANRLQLFNKFHPEKFGFVTVEGLGRVNVVEIREKIKENDGFSVDAKTGKVSLDTGGGSSFTAPQSPTGKEFEAEIGDDAVDNEIFLTNVNIWLPLRVVKEFIKDGTVSVIDGHYLLGGMSPKEAKEKAKLYALSTDILSTKASKRRFTIPGGFPSLSVEELASKANDPDLLKVLKKSGNGFEGSLTPAQERKVREILGGIYVQQLIHRGKLHPTEIHSWVVYALPGDSLEQWMDFTAEVLTDEQGREYTQLDRFEKLNGITAETQLEPGRLLILPDRGEFSYSVVRSGLNLNELDHLAGEHGENVLSSLHIYRADGREIYNGNDSDGLVPKKGAILKIGDRITGIISSAQQNILNAWITSKPGTNISKQATVPEPPSNPPVTRAELDSERYHPGPNDKQEINLQINENQGVHLSPDDRKIILQVLGSLPYESTRFIKKIEVVPQSQLDYVAESTEKSAREGIFYIGVRHDGPVILEHMDEVKANLNRSNIKANNTGTGFETLRLLARGIAHELRHLKQHNSPNLRRKIDELFEASGRDRDNYATTRGMDSTPGAREGEDGYEDDAEVFSMWFYDSQALLERAIYNAQHGKPLLLRKVLLVAEDFVQGDRILMYQEKGGPTQVDIQRQPVPFKRDASGDIISIGNYDNFRTAHVNPSFTIPYPAKGADLVVSGDGTRLLISHPVNDSLADIRIYPMGKKGQLGERYLSMPDMPRGSISLDRRGVTMVYPVPIEVHNGLEAIYNAEHPFYNNIDSLDVSTGKPIGPTVHIPGKPKSSIIMSPYGLFWVGNDGATDDNQALNFADSQGNIQKAVPLSQIIPEANSPVFTPDEFTGTFTASALVGAIKERLKGLGIVLPIVEGDDIATLNNWLKIRKLYKYFPDLKLYGVFDLKYRQEGFYGFHGDDFNQELVSTIERMAKKKGVRLSDEGFPLYRINMFIENPDSWKVLGAEKPLTPQETRERLEKDFPQWISKDARVEKAQDISEKESVHLNRFVFLEAFPSQCPRKNLDLFLKPRAVVLGAMGSNSKDKVYLVLKGEGGEPFMGDILEVDLKSQTVRNLNGVLNISMNYRSPSGVSISDDGHWGLFNFEESGVNYNQNHTVIVDLVNHKMVKVFSVRVGSNAHYGGAVAPGIQNTVFDTKRKLLYMSNGRGIQAINLVDGNLVDSFVSTEPIASMQLMGDDVLYYTRDNSENIFSFDLNQAFPSKAMGSRKAGALDELHPSQKREGGIDLNAFKINSVRQGSGINIKFNPAMIAQFQRGNFGGIVPVIIGIRTLANICFLLGFKAPKGV